MLNLNFQNRALSFHNRFVLYQLSKLVLFLLISFLPVHYHHIWNIWMLFGSFSSLSNLFVFDQFWFTKVRFAISSLNQFLLCLHLFLLRFPICFMYLAGEREQRWILAQRCEKLRLFYEREVNKCRRLFYELQSSWEKQVQRQKNECLKGFTSKPLVLGIC